jgi:DmsE family decaheme c-type cytochrome
MRVRAPLLGLWLAACCALAPASAWASPAPHPPDSQREKRFEKYVQIAGAEQVGSDQCRACHAEAGKSYQRTTHRHERVECEECHGPGSLHVKSADYGQIIKFRQKSVEAANGVCLGCHASTVALQNWFSGSHQAHEVRCTDCHHAHAADPKLESRRQQTEACLQCHRKQQAESNLPYHHPVREAKMGCADCHEPHGGTAANNLRADNLNELCFKCHAELEGPFTYQHAPVVESCAKCHSPHGSAHRNLLQVSEPMLCLQCHPGHHNGATISLLTRCTNCHSSIHGSDIPSATGGSVFIDKGKKGGRP